AYMKDPASVDKSLQEVALAIAALRGEATLFDTYRARFERAGTPTDRPRYLNGMGYFFDPELAKHALDYAAKGPLRPQEIMSIATTMGTRPELQEVVLQWTL